MGEQTKNPVSFFPKKETLLGQEWFSLGLVSASGGGLKRVERRQFPLGAGGVKKGKKGPRGKKADVG